MCGFSHTYCKSDKCDRIISKHLELRRHCPDWPCKTRVWTDDLNDPLNYYLGKFHSEDTYCNGCVIRRKEKARVKAQKKADEDAADNEERKKIGEAKQRAAEEAAKIMRDIADAVGSNIRDRSSDPRDIPAKKDRTAEAGGSRGTPKDLKGKGKAKDNEESKKIAEAKGRDAEKAAKIVRDIADAVGSNIGDRSSDPRDIPAKKDRTAEAGGVEGRRKTRKERGKRKTRQGEAK